MPLQGLGLMYYGGQMTWCSIALVVFVFVSKERINPLDRTTSSQGACPQISEPWGCVRV